MNKRLSEISYHEILTKATKEDIEKIVFEEKRLLDEKSPKTYDIGFIFGGISMIPYRVEKGLELYNQKRVDRLVVSGGIGFMNRDRKKIEADKMKHYLLEHGVPKEDIIVERFSRNTVENIGNTFKILDYEYGTIDALDYVLITSDFHVKRCLGLFEKAIGQKENFIGCGIKDGVKDKENWHNSSIGKKQIYQEAIALCMYAKKMRLENEEIKDLILKR